MASLLDKKESASDNKKNKIGFIIVAIFLAWLFLPFGGNKFVLLSYYSYNVLHFITQTLHITHTPEYLHMRNKAVYMVKIYPERAEQAKKEFDKAIALLPENHKEVYKLYRDRAQVKLYLGDKEGALEDLKSINAPEAIDTYQIGLLLADQGNYEEAENYCKQTIAESYQTMMGYVCMANIQEKLKNIPEAIEFYNLAIERSDNPNPKTYVERARLKRKVNDVKGVQKDLKTAKELSPYIDENLSIVGEVINPKTLTLTIK